MTAVVKTWTAPPTISWPGRSRPDRPALDHQRHVTHSHRPHHLTARPPSCWPEAWLPSVRLAGASPSSRELRTGTVFEVAGNLQRSSSVGVVSSTSVG